MNEDLLDLALLVLAAFWAWATVRFAAERFASAAFAATRPLHPFLVAILPLAVLWPDWVAALGVAGAVGILVGVTDKFLAVSAPSYVPPRRQRGGLPPLP